MERTQLYLTRGLVLSRRASDLARVTALTDRKSVWKKRAHHHHHNIIPNNIINIIIYKTKSLISKNKLSIL